MAKSKKKKSNAGRPRKYQTAEELQEWIDDYFENGMTKREVQVGKGESATVIEKPVPTMTELALFLGFEDRQSMLDYEKRGEFSSTIKTARARIEMHYEQLLQLEGSAGVIFALKNLGWKDRQDHEINERKIFWVGTDEDDPEEDEPE